MFSMESFTFVLLYLERVWRNGSSPKSIQAVRKASLIGSSHVIPLFLLPTVSSLLSLGTLGACCNCLYGVSGWSCLTTETGLSMFICHPFPTRKVLSSFPGVMTWSTEVVASGILSGPGMNIVCLSFLAVLNIYFILYLEQSGYPDCSKFLNI